MLRGSSVSVTEIPWLPWGSACYEGESAGLGVCQGLKERKGRLAGPSHSHPMDLLDPTV